MKGVLFMAEKKTTATETTKEFDYNAYLNEEVPVTMFYDGEKYKDDVKIGVNGKLWVIQRGKEVRIPRYVKMVLDNQMEQARFAHKHQDKYRI